MSISRCFRYLCLTAVVFGFHGVSAYGQSVAVSGPGDITTCVGQPLTLNFSAALSGAPTSTSECTITGPTWTWSGATGNGSSASTTVDTSSAGDRIIYVFASAAWTSSCTNGSGSANGNCSLTVHVQDWIWQDQGAPGPAQIDWTFASSGCATPTGVYVNQVQVKYCVCSGQTSNTTQTIKKYFTGPVVTDYQPDPDDDTTWYSTWKFTPPAGVSGTPIAVSTSDCQSCGI